MFALDETRLPNRVAHAAPIAPYRGTRANSRMTFRMQATTNDELRRLGLPREDRACAGDRSGSPEYCSQQQQHRDWERSGEILPEQPGQPPIHRDTCDQTERSRHGTRQARRCSQPGIRRFCRVGRREGDVANCAVDDQRGMSAIVAATA